MLNMNNVLSFLHFGFLTKVNPYNSQLISVDKLTSLKQATHLNDYTETDIIKKGVEIIRDSFYDQKGELFVVPLSGGIDSRTILAGLMHAGFKERIITVTFGTPRSWDFEIGVRLARKFNLKQEIIDLSKIKIDEKSLLNIAEEIGS